ncbi:MULTISPECIES: hypothetical protein [unclassified Caballeronia]|uniref:hypothetical protein n=1 Tax=unclassified Caballeronia TaxID=2646786 RepID=UPI002862DAE1|nr:MULTISPECIES: hypothetical protein [unclassified Caballeronia]MDR5777358.1 hypothetical protein [Caballeronia sp. LZ002]MDR5802530.1 hypothetical protein [Caballeronia sp. LZ001]MDR5852796.1 hypothetical protein [Caballeronia sp. LZ003]
MTIDELMKDIAIMFPRIKRMQRQYRWADDDEPRWMIGAASDVLFADALPIFWDLMSGEPSHDGGVHTAFTAWVESRGWYLERVDAFWWMPVEQPTEEEFTEMGEEESARIEQALQGPHNPFDCPF